MNPWKAVEQAGAQAGRISPAARMQHCQRKEAPAACARPTRGGRAEQHGYTASTCLSQMPIAKRGEKRARKMAVLARKSKIVPNRGVEQATRQSRLLRLIVRQPLAQAGNNPQR